MNFHEIRFPANLSFGSVGGPERRTDVVTLASGHEERNTPWAHSRRRYDAGLGLRSLDDIAELIAFFEARRGQLYGFRWKDWADFKSCKPSEQPRHDDQVIARGDGVTRTFQLIRTYSSGENSYRRPIQKPVAGTMLASIQGNEMAEGADYVVDPTSGLITFTQPPLFNADISAGYEFDVPVRFDSDRILTSLANFQAGEVPDVPVIEVRI